MSIKQNATYGAITPNSNEQTEKQNIKISEHSQTVLIRPIIRLHSTKSNIIKPISRLSKPVSSVK